MSQAVPLHMPYKQKQVPVYFIGVHHIGLKNPPVFFVKQRAYYAPTKKNDNGSIELMIGGTVMVFENDVDELILKTKAMIKDVGVVDTFTLDPNVAAQVRARVQSGNTAPISLQMTVAEAKSLLSPEKLAETVAENMDEDELERLLEAKRQSKKKKTLPPVVAEETN